LSNNDEAAKLALESGVDVELPFGNAYHSLINQVREGKVSQSDVDRAVARILRLKFLTGLFDDPSVDPEYAEKITNNAGHQQLALKAAHEAIILLKNQTIFCHWIEPSTRMRSSVKRSRTSSRRIQTIPDVASAFCKA
jgi:beta-glucosidase-like glycosyl hydrolase